MARPPLSVCPQYNPAPSGKGTKRAIGAGKRNDKIRQLPGF